MILKPQTPEDAIRKNKELNSFSPKEDYIKAFKKELKTLFDKIEIINGRDDDETEEHLKTDVREFLIHSVYPRDEYAINTKGKIDLAIYLGKDTNANVGVIIEAKRPKNKGEMISVEDVNKKALHEILLYSFKERETNPDLKYIIITNVEDWYLININDFENKHIFNNTNLKKEFNKIKDEGKTNPHYYEQVKKIIPLIDYQLPCVHFNLNDYKDIKDTTKDQKKLINLYKLLSPDFLLKKPLANDSNKLNTKFYNELLHIIGIEPVNEGGKIVIKRKAKPDDGSFLENTINILKTEDVVRKIANTSIYGNTNEDKLYNISLELVLTWINRVLFLKLLEGQLKSYNKDNPEEHKFLNPNKIKDFDELYKLFHQVLARNYDDRSNTIKKEYNLVPYLNSSLFEISELESLAIKINSLDDNLTIPVFNKTVIKTDHNKLNPLKYLLEFLNAYDFGSEKDETTASEKLINASVLGLIFEKINGYKDGSFYTPGFITQYMCKETIERAVIQKFNEVKGWDCKNLTELHNKEIDTNLKESNAIIDSVKICDPAVGSGHFLVSALNQMIVIKHELNVLVEDRTIASWKKLRGVDIKIINDELSIQVDETNFQYNPKSPQSQTIQKALFEEKQIIIENCLFGVDINPNSVKICRLRLWIELLKNAYYKEITLAGSEKIKVLETLPNIDINIKCGNSLISRFALDADLKEALKKSKLKIDDYKRAVDQYRNAESKEQKRDMEVIIEEIKSNFKSSFEGKFRDKITTIIEQYNTEKNRLDMMLQLHGSLKKEEKEKLKKLKINADNASKEKEETVNNKIYENAFEWRFEFPEILNDEGDFVGFDVVIGNPPYIRLQGISSFADYYNSKFISATRKYDIYVLFIEKSFELLKQDGFCNFILPHKFLISDFGVGIREYLIKNNALDRLTHFGSNIVFEDASTYTCLFSISKKENTYFNYIEIEPKEIIKSITYNKIEIKSLTSESWNLKDKDVLETLNKLNTGKYLKDISEGIYQGLISNGDDIFILKGYIDKGIFKGYSQRLNEEVELEAKIMKPILKGKNIQRYKPLSSDIYIIYPHKQNDSGKTIPLTSNELKNEYPLSYKYLEIFKDELITKKIKYKTNSKDWYSLHRSREINIFENDYLITPQLQNIPSFALNNSSFYADAGGYMINGIKSIKPKALLAILNSKIMWFFIKNTSSEYSGGYFYFKTAYLEPFPIPNLISLDNEKSLIDKVDQILSLKKDNSEADTSALELEIDIMVYALYQLTFEEVLIIDPNFNNLITKEKYEFYLKN
jgi:adenine-specific DNA-methyltransferase